ncbi:MAG: NAD-dependent epimerase/dehydratase family protein [Pseudomonadota bacterium]
MKVLITGNMGYVGPVVVKHLRAVHGSRIEISGVDAGFFANCLLSPWSPTPETGLDVQYYRDVRAVPHSLLVGVDAVVHLAAISNDPMGRRYESATEDINFKASVALAHLAAKAGAKSFVFASSCSVYGQASDNKARTEADSVNPLTAYARSKIATEDALRQADFGGMRVRCLRFATACGLSPRVRLDLVLNDFVAGAVANREISILSDGTPWRPLIDVADMARAIEWAIEADAYESPFLAVNVGSDEWNFQVSDIANAVAEIAPGTRVRISDSGQPDPRSYRVDFSLWSRLAPRHQPAGTLQESAKRLHEGLLEAGFQDAQFRESRLIRLKVLDNLRELGHLDPTLHWTQ